jgi:hypothetical protein
LSFLERDEMESREIAHGCAGVEEFLFPVFELSWFVDLIVLTVFEVCGRSGAIQHGTPY